MKKLTRYYKKIRFTHITVSVLAIIVNAFFLPYIMKIESTGNNIFKVFLNGEAIGVVGDMNQVETYVREVRTEIARQSQAMLLMETNISYEGEEVLIGKIDEPEYLIDNIRRVLSQNETQMPSRSYTVKINEYTVNLADSEEVIQLLQACIDRYGAAENNYQVELVLDPTRELNVLTTEVSAKDLKEEEEAVATQAGIELALTEMLVDVEPAGEKDFEDYELGLIDLRYGDAVEIVEAYLPEDELTPLSVAVEQITKDQEKEQIYEVVSGDTLSKIAIENNLTIDEIIAINPAIENESSLIRIGDEIIITVPEPELSVERKEELYYEEDYEAPIEYVYNDEWYTNQTKTLQEPSAGHRRVVAIVSFRNNTEVEREIIKEEIDYAAVPKIVEKGTKIPPTYIKPISGGRQSSGFGKRTAPTKGASTYHKGMDWSVPTGTAVVASSAGTVSKAGWGSGYGYVIYINHADGRQTRYGHLSKILVKQGQYVQQGEKIALSGNTGRSTGPHLHFEILINGTQVNPLKYLN